MNVYFLSNWLIISKHYIPSVATVDTAMRVAQDLDTSLTPNGENTIAEFVSSLIPWVWRNSPLLFVWRFSRKQCLPGTPPGAWQRSHTWPIPGSPRAAGKSRTRFPPRGLSVKRWERVSVPSMFSAAKLVRELKGSFIRSFWRLARLNS